jgi:hypothetical protein
VAVVLAGAPAAAQDEATPTAATPARAEPLGVRPGSHHLTLFGGFVVGGTVRDQQLEVPGATGPNSPAIHLELDDAGAFGLRYAYQLDENWALEVSGSKMSSELANSDEFDAEETANILGQSQLSPEDASDLAVRLAERSAVHDADVTFLDASAVYLVNPEGRWIGEVGGGIGWASSSIDGQQPVLFEELVASDCDPDDPGCQYTVFNTIPDPTDGTECPPNDQPCIETEEADGLTWHVLGGIRYVATETVQFRFQGKLRFIEQLTDPGDSYLSPEATLGVTFVLGGR